MTCTHFSLDYHNVFLKYMANNIKKYFVNNIKSVSIYSILVEETQDLGGHEQVSVCVRYIDDTFASHEVFLDFYKISTRCFNVKKSKDILKMHGFYLSAVRGQCYDGDASMRGYYSGVQSRTKEENPLALFIHCYANILNLCLVDLAKFILLVKHTFGAPSTTHNFIGAFSKIYAVFKKVQKESNNLSNKTIKSLTDVILGRTAELKL